MKKPDFGRAKKYILERLEKELDPRLSYHNIYHTESFVLPACERLAQLEEIVDNEEKILLLTAALYHDSGFIKQYGNNESIGAEIASKALPGFGYNRHQIETIQDIMMATALPQSPGTHLAQIMCDADLFHLGQNDFFILSNNLWHELTAYGVKIPEQKWFENTLIFLLNHRYFTKSAEMLNKKKKKKNIEKMKEKIEKFKTNN